MLELNKIHHLNVLDRPWDLLDESIDCSISSPPYWGLRDYGIEGQLGQEPTFKEYINNLCDVYDEVKRVLTKTGTCWVNLGDSYGGTGSKGKWKDPKNPEGRNGQEVSLSKNAPAKCLIQIPHRFAIEMCDRGWILRNTIIWHKPNAMPSSAKDRFTVDFEYLFFFVKNKKYYFEQQTEKALSHEGRPGGAVRNRVKKYNSKRNNNPQAFLKQDGTGNPTYTGFNARYVPSSVRNKRTVWTISTKPFKGAHFAVFPPELIKPPIKAGCPKQVCLKCGKPRTPIFNRKLVDTKGWGKATKDATGNCQGSQSMMRDGKGRAGTSVVKKVGYTDCGCAAGFRKGIVLDPFIGSGTTALVAIEEARHFIGFDLNKDYIKMAYDRLKPHLKPTIQSIFNEWDEAQWQ